MPPVLTPEQIEKKRFRLVQKAIEILEKDGVEALTARHLAEIAGVSRSTPYLYFKDKAAIIDAVKVRGLQLLILACEKSVAGADHFTERLRRLGSTYVDFGIHHPALYQLIFASGQAEGDMSDALSKTVEQYRQLTLGPMGTAWEAGILSMPPERLNLVLWSSIHGLLALNNAGHIGDEEALTNLRADLEIILAKGFLADSA